MSERPRVRVVCEELSHSDHRPIVATLVREDGEWLDLMFHGRVTEVGRPGGGPIFEVHDPPGHGLVEPHTGTIMSGDERVPYSQPRQKLERGQRRHHKLECPECGLARSVLGEKLGPVLDKLAAAGVPEISLKALITLLARAC